MTTVDVDRAVDRVARRQRGVFSHEQATAAGATERMIHRRLCSGRWQAVAPGVYAVPSHPADWSRNLMAAVLGEPEAVVGGASAAVIHQLPGFRPGRATIIVPRGSNHRSMLAVVRERSDYRATIVDGIPVLTLCDTFFSIASVASEARLAIALDDVLAARRLTIAELQSRYVDLRAGRRRGMATMRRLIDLRSEDAYVPPASVLEGLLYGMLDRPGMPRYQPQVALPWAPEQRVDAMLLDVPVIIEADGRRWHTRVADFERDRERDRAAALHGYHTLRYTWVDLSTCDARVESEIRSIAHAAA